MTKKKTKPRRSIPTNTPHAVLAKEVEQIETGGLADARFVDAPEAIPRAKESQLISLRLPVRLLAILRTFAGKEGVGYQVLLKRWLDDRVREEYLRIQQRKTVCAAPSFPLIDREPDGDGRHYSRAA
jgi:hypothetical protein